MAKKFIITDLDGTLLDTPGKLSKKYIEQLNKWIDQGLAFTIATGRDLKKTMKAINGLTLKYPVILTNGAILAELATETYLKITHIDDNISKHLVQKGQEFQLFPIVFAAFDPKKQQMHFNKGVWGPQKEITFLSSDKVYPLLELQCVSIQYHAKKEQLDPLLKWVKEKYGNQVNIIYIEDVAYSTSGIAGEWFWLEINSHEAGKDKMLKHLLSVINVKIEDVIAIGDNHNDTDMLKIASQGIAVANAVDSVKKIADLIIPSNHEGGVFQYIEEHLDEFI
ncbi:HMP-PP phosphatase [Candidatus Lokiarchaeum ossiferum]|uniref:HMP-PP phosphatase n=1 Tax=Candidatus Lokiarchaeum ossiferum TaxID=2951803 RepID=A0ABY6HXA0_9ARCH|nr:HMP-PP phosphatase [Candidatus Lokiarchaeum sp. B-35]